MARADDDRGFVDPARHLRDEDSAYGFAGGDILHPSDLNVDEGRAFAHALAIAVRLQSRLTLLHAGPRSQAIDGRAFPHVRETLTRWGLLDRGSSPEDVYDELGLDVKKLSKRSKGPMAAIQEQIDTRPVDMLVLATRGAQGLPPWLKHSVSDQLAKRAMARTLFVPRDVPGFVSLSDGSINLRRVLVPLAPDIDPRFATFAAPRFPQVLGQADVEFLALQVTEGDDEPPAVELPPTSPAGTWSQQTRRGQPAAEIIAAAREWQADVIVMITEGAHGVLDALRGSTTTQVLHRAPCPLMAVPANLFQPASR